MNRMTIDLGLTHTGWCTAVHSGVITIPPRTTVKPMTDASKQDRLAWWMRRLNGLIRQSEVPIDVLYVEAPFMSRAHPTGAVETLKLHGVLAAVAAINQLEVHYVENRTLSKLATGNGNASKDDMLARARELGLDSNSYDEADAFLLYHVIEQELP